MALDVNRAEKPVRKLRKLLKKMPAMPGADDIHDFRTSSRRIEATLQALSLDSGHNCRRILKQISRLRKRAGKVRDMDVLTDYLSSLPRHEKERGTPCNCSVSRRRSQRVTAQELRTPLQSCVRRHFAIRYCGGCRSATAISARRSRPSTWPATTGSSCIPSRCYR